jgi:hypothetical protein
MGIPAEEFVERYPLLWHMAEDGTWPAIRQQGLLSTSSLLDAYGVKGAAREKLEGQRRPSYVEVSGHGLPGAVIRDQAPISESVLARVLTGDLTPGDWYRILNSRVFFWVSEERLERLLRARLYRDRAHTVLVVDTAELLRRHGSRVTLSPINSGNTMMNARPRGLETFQPLESYPFDERRRAGLTPVVELAVEGSVPDIATLVVRVERRLPGGKIQAVDH